MSLLTVDNLTVAIDQTRILNGVSFHIEPGEIFGIIGESGSGKSITALSVMGLLPDGAATTGTITLEGTSILDASEDKLCALRGETVGMVFQEPMTALNPVQTIGAQVAEVARIHQSANRTEARQIAEATLTRVGLPPQAVSPNRYPHELSGGQRQRVVIAMAVALRPKLLIADEPTTALDVTTQAQVLDLIKRLVQEDGMGCMFITHDLGVVASLADRLAIMRAGEIVETGPTRDLLKTQSHPYTRALYAASSHIPDRTAPIADTDVLQVTNVTRTYPKPRSTPFAKREHMTAVDTVSFTIKRGENVGLVGASGCGKSTLARAILGLDPIQSGKIAVHGAEITSEAAIPREIRRQMQVVFQDPYGSFNPRHRVGRLISEPFHLLDTPPQDAEKRIAQALEDVGLTPSDATKYIHEFSGGQRQRIAIARALIIEPALIILDEPVSALDVSVRAQILDLLADLSTRRDLTYLFISHDLSVVRAITDRVLVMDAGSIVEEGPTETVFTAAKHPVTQRLIAAAPRLEAS